MNGRVVILPDADRDLDRQAEYFLDRKTPATAERWYERTAASFEFLVRQPGIGTAWESRHPALAGIRTWPVDGLPKHIIFYRPIADGIEVVRILHGARDLEAVLRLGHPGG
jgi:toxin ParE1/3/4